MFYCSLYIDTAYLIRDNPLMFSHTTLCSVVLSQDSGLLGRCYVCQAVLWLSRTPSET